MYQATIDPRKRGLTLAAIILAHVAAIYAALMHLGGVHHILAKVLSNGFSFAVNYLVRRRYF